MTDFKASRSLVQIVDLCFSQGCAWKHLLSAAAIDQNKGNGLYGRSTRWTDPHKLLLAGSRPSRFISQSFGSFIEARMSPCSVSLTST